MRGPLLAPTPAWGALLARTQTWGPLLTPTQTWGPLLLLLAVALGSTGCAAVFRESRPKVRVESDPPGAEASVKDGAGTTPVDITVPRSGLTEVRVSMFGFEEHRGTVRKHINGLWLTADLATCIVPVLACVPLLVDAISGAWIDVEPRYHMRLVPLEPSGPALALAGAGTPPAVARPSPPPSPLAPATPIATPASTMSESERKATARAAYQEGLELQAQKRSVEALARFQDAQHIYDAPTHLLRIAQCLVVTGKLVEARETYELLARRELPRDASEPFREVVEIGKQELAALRPRIPTLRIEIQVAPGVVLKNLALQINGQPLPSEVIGIARPLNPGIYRITATAWGAPPSKPIEIVLKEGDAKSADVKMGR